MRSERHLLRALAAIALAASPAAARQPTRGLPAGELSLALDRLSVLGSALYVAAHPDDENTAFLAWLEHERYIRAGYVSLTRGDGGQNLIGSEQGDRLGIVRTQELLAARALDGAEQYFSRAIDFGFSKSTAETLGKWDREAVLADLVLVIRQHRPDIIVTRFSETVGGHGHHTASASLALEAFTAAGDPARFPRQLESLAPWQPRRLYWNAWQPKLEDRAPDAPPLVKVELGGFNPRLGASYPEVAALSRSMHKSQGFGQAGNRGSRIDYFELTAGEPVAAGDDLFAGIDLSWGRVPGSERLAGLLAEARAGFEAARPATVLPKLLAAHDEIRRLPESYWTVVKRHELEAVIRAASGLWLEAIAAAPTVVPGGQVAVTTTAVNRSPESVELRAIELTPYAAPGPFAVAPLEPGTPVAREWSVAVPGDAPLTEPYWLAEPPTQGTFTVTPPGLRGRAQSGPALTARFHLAFGSPFEHVIVYEEPVLYRWTDPVRGELYRDLVVTPPVSVGLDDVVYLFSTTAAKEIAVTVRAWADAQTGSVTLRLPDGFRAEPTAREFALAKAGDEAIVRFRVTPPAGAAADKVAVEAQVAGVVHTRGVELIDHPHIPIQTLMPVASAPAVRVDLGAERPRIGYITGPGDKVPEALRQAGYDVRLLDDAAIDAADFTGIDTIVTGVRAYNTRTRLAQQQRRLLDWVAAGGTLVVQYNVDRGLVLDPIGPYPMKLSRVRVTVEEAAVRFVDPAHPALNRPNRITAADFDGWVQERGLYFADPWDDRYQTVLACHDPDEPDAEGGLLYARHGKGVFIYTGYAWFRQLPAGVPGAFRLFANLLAAGK